MQPYILHLCMHIFFVWCTRVFLRAARNARCALSILEDNGNHDSMSDNTHDSTHATAMDTNQCTTPMQYNNIKFLDLQAASENQHSVSVFNIHAGSMSFGHFQIMTTSWDYKGRIFYRLFVKEGTMSYGNICLSHHPPTCPDGHPPPLKLSRMSITNFQPTHRMKKKLNTSQRRFCWEQTGPSTMKSI